MKTILNKWAESLNDRRVIENFLAWCAQDAKQKCSLMEAGKFEDEFSAVSSSSLLDEYFGINQMKKESYADRVQKMHSGLAWAVFSHLANKKPAKLDSEYRWRSPDGDTHVLTTLRAKSGQLEWPTAYDDGETNFYTDSRGRKVWEPANSIPLEILAAAADELGVPAVG